MTCIVWDGKTLAADRNTGITAISEWEEQKIFKINGYLLGFSGFTTTRDKIITWLISEKVPEKKPILPEGADYTFLVIDMMYRKSYLYGL